MKIKVYAATDVGCVRSRNEDGFYINGLSINKKDCFELSTDIDDKNIFIALMDGITSTEDGSEAVALLSKFFSNNEFSSEKELEEYIKDANLYVIKNSEKDTATTVSGFFVLEDKIKIFNAGDSKIYKLNNGYLMQLSVDDVANQYLDIKQPLIQCIGMKKHKYDFHISEENIGTYLLCSDGITDMLSVDDMENIFKDFRTPERIGKALIKAAKSRGGYDNITVIVIGEAEYER